MITLKKMDEKINHVLQLIYDDFIYNKNYVNLNIYFLIIEFLIIIIA